MNIIKHIIKKEIARVFGDKKLIFSLFILPPILMIGIMSLGGTLAEKTTENVQSHKSIIYVQNVPEGFKEFLNVIKANDNSEINYIDSDVAKIKEDILNGTADLLIEFEEGFLNKINNYTESLAIPQIKTYYNPSEDYSNAARSIYVNGILETYRQALLTERIGDLSSITVFTIDTDNEDNIIQDDAKATGKMLGTIVPYFVTLLLFAGVMGLGIDAITGEKERGTLASMLVSPVKRSQIVLGKIFSLMILSGLSASAYIISMIVAMPIMMKSMGGGGDLSGLSIEFSIIQIAQLAAIIIALAFLYVAIVATVAVFAKTVKEGSTYVMPAYIVVIISGLITMFSIGDTVVYQYLIPLYGSALAIKDLLSNDLSLISFAFAMISTLGLGAILAGIMVKAFNSEKIMFNS